VPLRGSPADGLVPGGTGTPLARGEGERAETGGKMRAGRVFLFLSFLTAFVLSSQPAFGSDNGYVVQKKGRTTIKYKKKNSYDFEGANIDGIYNKPSGAYISNLKDVKARSILFVKKNFDAEVIDSARLVR
jgi:hypothetical protein